MGGGKAGGCVYLFNYSAEHSRVSNILQRVKIVEKSKFDVPDVYNMKDKCKIYSKIFFVL